MLMRAGILVGGVAVVLVGEMVVVVGIVFFEEWSLCVTEVESWRVGFGLVGSDICDFGGGFVVVVVEIEVSDLELEVGDVVRMVWSVPSNWPEWKPFSQFLLPHHQVKVWAKIKRHDYTRHYGFLDLLFLIIWQSMIIHF